MGALDDAALHGAELLRWPVEDALRQHLARAGIPRLLLVEGAQPPPADLRPDEDWLRAPATVADVEARAVALVRRVRERAHEGVWVEGNRVLHRGSATAVLSEAEALVASLLLDAPGQVVRRELLAAQLWPGREPPGRRALDAVVGRLRRRLAGLGIRVESVRSRGVRLCLG
jgi:DNA-binding response OmpR family regulator